MADGAPRDDDRRLFGVPAWRWTALSAVAAALGGLFAVYQYAASVEAARAKQTLEMIDRWRDDGYRDRFLELRDRTVEVLSLVPEDQMAAAASDVTLARNLRRNVADRAIAAPEDLATFEEVVYFFNLLGLCVEAKLCSRQTARVFFDDTLQNFWSVYGEEIKARQQDAPGYGEGVTYLMRAFLRWPS